MSVVKLPDTDWFPVHAPDAVQDVTFVDDHVSIAVEPAVRDVLLLLNDTVVILDVGVLFPVGVLPPPPPQAVMTSKQNNIMLLMKIRIL